MGTGDRLISENQSWISVRFPGLPHSLVSSWNMGGGGGGHFQKSLRSLTSQAALPVGVKPSLECHSLCWQVIHWDKGWSSSIKKMSDKTPNAYKWLFCKQWNDWETWPNDALHVWTSLQETWGGEQGHGELFSNRACEDGCFLGGEGKPRSSPERLVGEWMVSGWCVDNLWQGQSEKCVSRAPEGQTVMMWY